MLALVMLKCFSAVAIGTAKCPVSSPDLHLHKIVIGFVELLHLILHCAGKLYAAYSAGAWQSLWKKLVFKLSMHFHFSHSNSFIYLGTSSYEGGEANSQEF